MGSQTDKIQKLLNQYTKKKNWSSKGWLKILKDNLGKDEWKRLKKEATKSPPPFNHFHKSWSKKNVLDIWKGDTWESVIRFCDSVDIKPKEVMKHVAGRKINKTNYKTIQIAELMYSRASTKISPRSLAIHLKKELIKIDKSLANRGDEKEKHWHERIYQRAFKALQRYDL
mgnify:CR=1 FL=1